MSSSFKNCHRAPHHGPRRGVNRHRPTKRHRGLMNEPLAVQCLLNRWMDLRLSIQGRPSSLYIVRRPSGESEADLDSAVAALRAALITLGLPRDIPVQLSSVTVTPLDIGNFVTLTRCFYLQRRSVKAVFCLSVSICKRTLRAFSKDTESCPKNREVLPGS